MNNIYFLKAVIGFIILITFLIIMVSFFRSFFPFAHKYFN